MLGEGTQALVEVSSLQEAKHLVEELQQIPVL